MSTNGVLQKKTQLLDMKDQLLLGIQNAFNESY